MLSGPSTLVVPVSRLPLTGVSSCVVTISLASLRPSATGVMLIVSVDASLFTPSVTV